MKFKIKYIMLLLALSVAGCAAYFSVWGLSQLFAGASTAVIIMASVLEIGKIVTTTALHTYWDKLAKGLRAYLTLSVAVLMFITSAGIYGFLSNAYQKTANKLEIHEGELGVLNGKKQTFEKKVTDNQKIIDSKNKRIDQLSGLRTSQEARLDGSKSNKAMSNVRGDISSANSEIQKLSADIEVINTKNEVLSDSINDYNTKVLNLKSGSEVAAEVGPLKYIAELTGLPMPKVVNYLILLLIFVFDPLAVALILITNRVFQIDNGEYEPQPRPEMVKKTKESILAKIKNYKEKIKEVKNVKVQTNPDVDVNRIELPRIHTGELDNVNINEEIQVVEPEPHVEEVEQPISGKIKVDDIKEVKERNRGFSVNIPQPKGNNTIQRVGGLGQPPRKNNSYFKRD